MSVIDEVSDYLGEALLESNEVDQEEESVDESDTAIESKSPIGEHIDSYLTEKGRRDDANFRNVKGLTNDMARVLDKNFSHPKTPFWAKSARPSDEDGHVAEIEATFDDDVDRLYRERGKLEQDLDTGLRPYGVYPRVEIKPDKSGARIKLMKMAQD